jgi:hypothetical protein
MECLSLSLYGSSVREMWREGSFTGNSASYVRHVKQGNYNAPTLSREGNLERGLLN